MEKDIDKSLADIGLHDDQIKVYKTLLNLGPAKAFRIAFSSGVKRALTYKVLKQLQDLGLVEAKETEEEKVTTFSPTHPSNLEKLILKKKEGLFSAEHAYKSIFQTLSSSYNIANKKPNMQFFEGEQGPRHVFDDIIKQKSDVLLLRSYLDDSSENFSKLIDEHKERRKHFGLGVRVISSRKPSAKVLEHDEEYGVTRRYLSEDKFALPAEINVYADKVAIISYGTPLVTTLIESKDIAASFRTLFELVWSQAIAPEKVLS